jgi:hypothetical protein
LSTVIVGLATVAGIQAFSENQKQATQDALVQRAITLGNEVKAAHETPDQLGGITLGNGDNIAGAIGVNDVSSIPAEGAGKDAECKINDQNDPTVECSSNGPTGGDVEVKVDVNPDADSPVKVDEINVSS